MPPRTPSSRNPWDWERTASRPLAADGIKAKSQRGDIGDTWWSKRFISVLESFSVGGRMASGRSYARKGQVLDFAIGPGVVVARVQGSRTQPYALTIEVKRITAAEWQRVEDVLGSRALFLAKLLAGEMPDEIEQAFSAAGVPLFPSSRRELVTRCSCPDWENPCKHIAATLYLLAERFDEDPFEIFAWRGRTRDALLASLRAARGESAEVEAVLEPTDGWPVDDGDEAEPEVAAFWSTPDAGGVDHQPRVAPVPDALLRELDPLDLSVRGRTVAEILSARYAEIAEAAERRALDER